jgi:hypothetical protein
MYFEKELWLIQQSAYRGSSHPSNVANGNICAIIWLYLSFLTNAYSPYIVIQQF